MSRFESFSLRTGIMYVLLRTSVAVNVRPSIRATPLTAPYHFRFGVWLVVHVAHLLPPRNMCITSKKLRRDVSCFLTGPDLFLVPFLFLGDFVPHVRFPPPLCLLRMSRLARQPPIDRERQQRRREERVYRDHDAAPSQCRRRGSSNRK